MAAKQTPVSTPPVLVGVPGAAADLTAQPRQILPFNGAWTLNVDASVHPDGPVVPPRGPWPEARGPGSAFDPSAGALGSNDPAGVTYGATSSAGGASGARALSEAAQVRFDAATTLFFTAPRVLGVSATATEFTLVLDPTNRLGYMHRTDNNARTLVTSAGPAVFKVRWDGHKIRREIRTKDSLKITEEYTLSPDGKRLTVVVKASSSMVSMTKHEIKRVYDRVVVP
jgi:hypothetical protein